MRIKRALVLTVLCASFYQANAFDEELEAALRYAPEMRELQLRYEKAVHAVRLLTLDVLPSLYLTAPQAYSYKLSPEQTHRAAATAGIQYSLPFGLGLDLSWQQQLAYTPLLEDKGNELLAGFSQPVSAGIQLSVPLFVTPYLNAAHKSADIMNQMGQAEYDLGVSQFTDRFVQSWFALYRLQEQLQLLRKKLAVLAERRDLVQGQVSEGRVALHVLWESERLYRKAEIQLMQSAQEFVTSCNQFHIKYSIDFPDSPDLPVEAFTFEAYGITPTVLANQLRQAQEALLLEIRARTQRSSSFPTLFFAASFQGSVTEKPMSFNESFMANFKNLDDWKPLLSVGFSLSTKDIGRAVYAGQDARLEAALLATAHSTQTASSRVQSQQLLALQTQYERFMQSQKTSLDEILLYYNDMATQADRGALDAIELSEVGLLVAEMQSEYLIIYAYWLETELRIKLFGFID